MKKIYKFQDLERDIADKSVYLERQRQLITLERKQLKKIWIQNITSPSALLLSFSIGFTATYLRKSKSNEESTPGRLSNARVKLQTAIFNSIKRFTSGVVIGLISSITAQKGGPLAIIGQEE